MFGGLGEKETSRGFNRATQAKRQTGSAIKPIAILMPGIEKKIFTASTIFNDEDTAFNDGTDEGYHPKNYDGYMGEITVRQAIESSQNIPFVKMMEKVTPKTSIDYLEKMGITTLKESDENLSLALGGVDNGMTVLETAGAYACIANDGVYIEPTFYTKIENSKGKVVLKTKQKKKKVVSKETAYIVKQLLKEPVEGTSGTATYCNIDGIDVAAKTGTTNENYDRWLCGFTPYYTSAVWFGYDINETIEFNSQNPAGLIWSNVMKKAHKNLGNKTFEKQNKIQSFVICRKTGKKANDYCIDTYTEYYLKGTEPGDCSTHSSKNKGKKSTKPAKNNSAGETSRNNTENNKKTEEEKDKKENNNSQNKTEEQVNKADEEVNEENEEIEEEVVEIPEEKEDTEENATDLQEENEITENVA